MCWLDVFGGGFSGSGLGCICGLRVGSAGGLSGSYFGRGFFRPNVAGDMRWNSEVSIRERLCVCSECVWLFEIVIAVGRVGLSDVAQEDPSSNQRSIMFAESERGKFVLEYVIAGCGVLFAGLWHLQKQHIIYGLHAGTTVYTHVSTPPTRHSFALYHHKFKTKRLYLLYRCV